MSTSAQARPITAEELLAMGDLGRCELVHGELVMMSPAGAEHGVVAVRFARFLAAFAEDNNLGVVFAAETGFRLADDLVRAPDVAFVSKARVPAGGVPRQFFPGAPDLVVEVLSPDDQRRSVAEKINTWLAHGTQAVWQANPATQSVTIHRTGTLPVTVDLQGELRDEPLLPGFVLPVARIFRLP